MTVISFYAKYCHQVLQHMINAVMGIDTKSNRYISLSCQWEIIGTGLVTWQRYTCDTCLNIIQTWLYSIVKNISEIDAWWKEDVDMTS